MRMCGKTQASRVMYGFFKQEEEIRINLNLFFHVLWGETLWAEHLFEKFC